MVFDFNSLPPHVRGRIYMHTLNLARAANDPLTPYAIVSREFQQCAERQTFAALRLSPGRRLEECARIVTPHRHHLVRSLLLRVDTLHRYRKGGSIPSADIEAVRRRSSRVLTSAVSGLFDVLRHWSGRNGNAAQGQDGGMGGVELKDVDSGVGLRLHLEIDASDHFPCKERYLHRVQQTSIYLDQSVAALPTLASLDGLQCSGRHVELESTLRLLSKLEDLSEVDIEIEHDFGGESEVANRRALMLHLQQHHPNLSVLRLHRPISKLTKRVSGPNLERESFYSLLRDVSRRLYILSFDDCVDAREFFRPLADESERKDDDGSFERGERHQSRQNSWPHLQELDIRNSYMLRRPYRRVSSRTEALAEVHRLWAVLGRAAGQMPEMSRMRARMYVSSAQLEWYTLAYGGGEDSTGSSGPMLSVVGLAPPRRAVEQWRASVRIMRGQELILHIPEGIRD